MEQEKFQFGSHQEGVPHRFRYMQGIDQPRAWIAIEAFAIGRTYIADDTRHCLFLIGVYGLVDRRLYSYRSLRTHLPRENSKGVEVGEEVHVTFCNTCK